jgi:hypothetical protein
MCSCGQAFDPSKGEPLVATPIKSSDVDSSAGAWLIIFGYIMAIGGFVFALICCSADTTAGSGLYGGERVYNFGLMDQRRNVLLVSLFVSGVGVALALAGRTKH